MNWHIYGMLVLEGGGLSIRAFAVALFGVFLNIFYVYKMGRFYVSCHVLKGFLVTAGEFTFPKLENS